jgi:predicted kinase
MSTKYTTKKPFVLMMYGFPGAGKTNFARQLAEELQIVHLQEDKVRHDLFAGSAIDENNEEWLRTIMDYMTLELLNSGVSVVYDADVMKASERKRVREIALANKAPAVLVWLQVDPETSYGRTQRRDRRKADDKYAVDYDENTFRSVIANMQNPSREEYIVISGKHTFSSQRNAVNKRLYELGVITPETANQNVVKPGLVNLIPQNPAHRNGVPRRNINIR